jgi:hypothetical protein
MYKRWLILVGLLTLFLGCTDKKNTVGFENQNPPQEIILNDSIFVETNGAKFYSFEDSLKNYQSNDKLIVANYPKFGSNNEIRTLFRLITLPTSVLSIDSEIKMTLPIMNSSQDFTASDLKFGKITTNWSETKATWYSAIDSTDTPDWNNPGGDFEEIDFQEVIVESDTVFITIQEELLTEWIDDINANYGIIIYTQTPGLVIEFNSSESIYSPKINFTYTNSNEESVDFNKSFTYDTFIAETDDVFSIYPNQLILSNIQPIRTYLKFNLDKSYFNIIDSTQFKRITINKAELYFIRKTENEYFEQTTFSIKPYLVSDILEDTTSENEPMITDDNYEDLYNITSVDSLKTSETDFFKVDISKMVQSFISNNTENNGILLRSIYESKDLKYLEFEPSVKLRIIYTLPMVE